MRGDSLIRVRNICEFLDNSDVDYFVTGNVDDIIDGFSSLSNYKTGTVTWCKNKGNVPIEKKDYSLVIVGIEPDWGDSFTNRIETDNPKKAFFMVVDYFFGNEEALPEIGSNTYISPMVKIGKNVKIGHNCTLSGNITIGDNTIIYNNVNIINKVVIGENCVIHSGTNIGHDDFAYTEDELFNKSMIKHYGGVKIGDNVFIASNCIINRGTIDDTEICDGVKIDAQCHISHNVHIGKNSALVSGSRLYGSVKTGENVYIASAIIKNQLVIGDNAVVGMGSVVLSNVDDNAVVVGSPAKRIR